MDTNDSKVPPSEDNPFKKAAMAAIGAISGAVEKFTEAINEATTQENIDKMARKGESTYDAIKVKGEDIFKRVKDFGSETAEKAKGAVNDTQAERHAASAEAKSALAEAIEGLRTMAQQSKEAISSAVDSQSFRKFTDDLNRGIKAGKEEIEKLIRRVRELEADEDADSDDDDVDGIDESRISEPRDGEIVYMSNRPPKNADEKVDYEPTDDDAASPTAPDDENNTNKLKSGDMNDHIPQSVPPEY